MTLLRILALLLSLPGLLALPACSPGGSGEGPEAGGRLETTPVELSALEGGGMPHLSPLVDGGVLLSWLAPRASAGEGSEAPAETALARLRAVEFHPGEGFGQVRTVLERDDLFVNWADFPSVVEVGPDRWAAHWLQRGAQGGYDYAVRVANSSDAGETWSEPWTLHDDVSPTEHGFVSLWPAGEGGWGAVWLDGRKYADGSHGSATEEMTLRSRLTDAQGVPGPEWELDARVCDCCQTDVARTATGPVIVYRDRSPEEVRDIHVVRWDGEAWSTPRPVHRDGWVIPGCPVNGPAVDTRSGVLAVAWFSAPGDAPRVQVAFSDDDGATFAQPSRIDDGRPLGRVDVVVDSDGSALVLWLEEVGNGTGELRLRRAYPDGSLGPSHTVATTRSARASGFPQLLPLGDGSLFAAWTEASAEGPSAVRVAWMEPPR